MQSAALKNVIYFVTAALRIHLLFIFASKILSNRIIMATLVENFICQHFDNIYRQICSGTNGQHSWRRHESINGGFYYDRWTLDASKSSVLESIHQFLHLCFNAGMIGAEHKMIEEWTRYLLINACLPAENRIADSFRYSKLVEVSDQITKFFFGCFDWQITDVIPGDLYDNKYIDKFDARVDYYKRCADRSGYKYTAQLLYNMKAPRNKEAHSATADFYEKRPECLQRLVYHLYDYITIFYMISHVCRDTNGKRISLLTSKLDNTVMPTTFLTTHIVVECVDEASGETLSGRKADIRLYHIEGNSHEVLVSPTSLVNPNCFEVHFFESYILRMVDAGKESNPSERFTIEYDFIDNTIVKLNIPPKGSPKPKKVSIRELIFSDSELPVDVKWILGTIEQFAGSSEYAGVARLLALASVTKSDASKKAYEEAVQQLEVSLKDRLKGDNPSDFGGYIKMEMESFREHLASPYKGKDDFYKLCESIDQLYRCFDFLKSGYDITKPLTEQIKENIEEQNNGKGVSVGTTVSDRLIDIHKELDLLENILSMKESYPEIIETEFGKNWLQNRIEQLYVDQVNYYMDTVIPLWQSFHAIHDYLKAHTDSQNEDDKAILVYADITDRLLNDIPENVIRIVMLSSDTFLFWLEKLPPKGDEMAELTAVFRDQVTELKNNRSIEIPMIPVSIEEVSQLKEQLKTLRTKVAELKNGISKYRQDFDATTKIALERRKMEYNKLARLVCEWDAVPDHVRETRSEVRFECLSQIVTNCDPETFMQFVCSSLNTRYEFGCLLGCEEMGISCNGLYDEWVPVYTEWEKQNKVILNECRDIVLGITKKYASRKKTRVHGAEFITDTEINDMHASKIVEHQIQQIEANYGTDIPDYISDIIAVPEDIVPSHVKALFLQNVLKPSYCPTENLLHIIDGVARYFGYSSTDTRGFLSKYIARGYSKRIMNPEALEEYKNMTEPSQRLYLNLLMNQKHPMGAPTGTRFLTACKLYYQGDTSPMPLRDFYVLLSKFRLDTINYYESQSLLDSYKVISMMAEYIGQHSDDQEMIHLGFSQITHFLNFCKDYLDKHMEACPIKKGKRPSLDYGIFSPVRKELKGKSLLEQKVIKYKSLHINQSEYIMHNSGWCEVEEELFNDIIISLAEESPECQQDISDSLWIHMFYRFNIPYTDVLAKRLITLKPFFLNENFEKSIKAFYIHCAYGKVKIANPSIIDGLNKIRELFDKYGQNIEVIFDGQPTAFVDNLITISQIYQDYLLWQDKHQ